MAEKRPSFSAITLKFLYFPIVEQTNIDYSLSILKEGFKDKMLHDFIAESIPHRIKIGEIDFTFIIHYL